MNGVEGTDNKSTWNSLELAKFAGANNSLTDNSLCRFEIWPILRSF
jgi:hypothetical protein